MKRMRIVGIGGTLLLASAAHAQHDPNVFQFQRECPVYATKRDSLKSPAWTKLDRNAKPGSRIKGVESKALVGQVLFSSPRYPGLVLKVEKACFDATMAIADDLAKDDGTSDLPPDDTAADAAAAGAAPEKGSGKISDKSAGPKKTASQRKKMLELDTGDEEVPEGEEAPSVPALKRARAFYFSVGLGLWREPFKLTVDASSEESLIVKNVGLMGAFGMDVPLRSFTFNFSLGALMATSVLTNRGDPVTVTYSAKSIELGIYGEPAIYYTFINAKRQLDVGLGIPLLGRFGSWGNTDGSSGNPAVTIAPRFAIVPAYVVNVRYARRGWSFRPTLTLGLTGKWGYPFGRLLFDFSI